jgi:hypothetical protein
MFHMLPLILFAASLLSAPQAVMTCANPAQTETQPVRGPAGASAVLKVSSTDDASKDSHECNANYKLVFTPPGGSPIEADVITSDGEYGRSLTARLAGFSRDGKHVLGILFEGEKNGATILFDYHAGDEVAQIADLRTEFARIAPAGCIQTLGVIGMTASGAIVVESSSDHACGASRRWLVDPSRAKAQPLPQGATILALYESASNR